MTTQTLTNKVMTIDELSDIVSSFWRKYARKYDFTWARLDPFAVGGCFTGSKLDGSEIANNRDNLFAKNKEQEFKEYNLILLDVDTEKISFTIKLVARPFAEGEWEKIKDRIPAAVFGKKAAKNDRILAQETYSFNGTPKEVYDEYYDCDPINYRL